MKQQKAKEVLRLAPKSSREIDFEIRKLDEEAEKAAELGLSIEDVRALDKLKPNLLLDEQKIGWHALETITINLLTRLKKKNARLNLKKIKPDNIRGIVSKSKIRTNKAEKLAMRKINELNNQTGITADHLRNDWTEMFVEPAVSATQGWTEKLGKAWDRDPWGTAGLMIAGAAGVYIGFRALKGIWGWITGKGKGVEKEKKGFFSMPSLGNISPLAIIAAGLFLGRGELKRLIYAKLGLKLDDEKLDRVKNAAQKGINPLKKELADIKEKLEEEKNAAKKTVEENKFEASKTIFMKLYFLSEREAGGRAGKGRIKLTINELKGTSIGTIQNIYANYKDSPEIIKQKLGIKTAIPNKHLIELIGGILSVKAHFSKAPEEENLGKLFERMIDDTLYRINSTFQVEVMDKIKNGSVSDLAKIDFDKLDKSLKEKDSQIIETISGNLKIDTTNWLDKEKKTLKILQIQLFWETILDVTPKDAVNNAILGADNKIINIWENVNNLPPKVRQAAEKFYKNIHDKASVLLPKCHERFGIKKINEKGEGNILKTWLTTEHMTFRHGVLLVLAAEGMDWKEKDTKKTHWIKDFTLLNVILRVLPPSPRKIYISQLSKKFVESETNLNLPSLRGLAPYIKKFGITAGSMALGWLTGMLEITHDYRELTPSEKKDFREKAKNSFWISFGLEAGGGGLQMLTESMALLMATIGADEETLGGTQTAEDFFKLISEKGGQIIYPQKSPGTIVIKLGHKYFWAKPWGILRDALGSITDGDLGVVGAAKVITVGSAPFVVIGGLRGLKRGLSQGVLKAVTSTLGGAARGLKYPLLPMKVMWKGAKVAYTLPEYAKRPAQFKRNVWRWTADKRKYGLLERSKNLSSLLEDGEKLLKYYKAEEWISWKDIPGELKNDPKVTLRRIFLNKNRSFALRYAKRYGKRYLRFFNNFPGSVSPFNINQLKQVGKVDTIRFIAEKVEKLKQSLKNLSTDKKFLELKKMLVEKNYTNFDDLKKVLEKSLENSFDANEAKALMKRITKEKDIKNLIGRVEDGSEFLKSAAKAKLYKKLIIRLAKADNADDVIKILSKKGIKINIKYAQDIAGTKSHSAIKYYLEELKESGEAGRTEGRLAKLRKGAGKGIGKTAGKTKEYAAKGSKKLKTWIGPTKFADADISKLVKNSDAAEIQKLLKGKGLKAESEIAERIAKAGNIDDIKYIIREVAKENGKIVKFIAKLSKAGKVLKFAKPAVPITFGAAAFIGAGMDYYQALSTENKEKQKLYFEKGHFGTIAGGIEAGAMIGYGAFSGAAAWAAAATAPYLYMTDTAYESALEAETTSEEWAQRCDHETLIHHWISTGKGGLTAGEAYRMVLPMMTFERIGREHKETRWKIADAIVLQEGDRFENETTLRQMYLAKRNYSIPTNYEMARNQLHRSKLYAEIIHARSVAMANPPQEKYPKIGEFDILNPKFSPAKMSFPDTEKMINIYEKEAFEQNVHPLLAKNFKNLSTGELLDYYMKVDKYLSDKRNEVTENEIYFRDQLKHYLMFNRQTDAIRATRNNYIKTIRTMIIAEKGELPDDIKKLQAAEKKALKKIKADYKKSEVLGMMEFFETGQKELEIKNEKITDNEACYALYKLARFFGYSGLQNEEHLKAFFDEEHKTAFAIYWDGDEWTVNEAGWEWDNDVGDDLTLQTVKNMIKELRGDPENILEHRQEALVMSTSEIFKTQVLHMADILENSLNSYEKQKKAPQLPLTPQKEPAKEKIKEEALVS